MTIFNWVQKKLLHQNVIKDGEKKKRSEGVSEIEKNTRSMLDQVDLVDALDNWFDGVLAIGTFGFDTLKFPQEDEVRDDDDDECDSVDLDYVVIHGSIIKNVDQESDPLISNENKVYDHHGDFGILDTDHIDSIKTVVSPMVSAEIEAEPELQKKRTTLAELFKEDQDSDTWQGNKPKNHNLDEKVQNRNHKVSKPRSKFSFTKKKMIKSKSKNEEEDDLRPIKKMRQMMKRMLKNKIHPDIDPIKAVKKETPYKPNRRCEALESLHLLNDNNGLRA